jgi:polysaccharide export outer membrane protein
MLRQVFLMLTLKQRNLPSGRAAVHIAMLILICAGSLAGCATSSDQIVGNGGPGFYAFQSNSDVPGSNAAGFQSPTSGGTPRDAQPPGALSAASPTGRSGYLIGALDVLEISVFKVPELSKSVQVADTGTINLPLLGDVPVVGKTPNEIEKEITRQL